MININLNSSYINKTLYSANKACMGVPFKSGHLCDVKIYDNEKPVLASVKKLNVDDEDYQKAVEEVAKYWKSTAYAEGIARPFSNKIVVGGNNKFVYYALETLDQDTPDKKLSRKIKGLAMCINKNSEELRVSHIQVSPDAICDVNKKDNRRYKNVGKMLMYGIIRQAYKEKIPGIKLKTAKKEFYKKLGFQLEEPICVHSEMILNREDYKSSLNKIEKDFGLKLTV